MEEVKHVRLAYRDILALLQRVIDHNRSRGSEESKTLVWYMINSRDPLTGKLDDDEQIKAEMMTFIIAGVFFLIYDAFLYYPLLASTAGMDTSSHTIGQ